MITARLLNATVTAKNTISPIAHSTLRIPKVLTAITARTR